MRGNEGGNPLLTFTANRRPYLDRGKSKQDGSQNQAAWATWELLVICKFVVFKEAPHLYSLTKVQNPRRNRYAPR